MPCRGRVLFLAGEAVICVLYGAANAIGHIVCVKLQRQMQLLNYFFVARFL